MAVPSLLREGNNFSSFNFMPQDLNGCEHRGAGGKETLPLFFHSVLTGKGANVKSGFQHQ